MKAVAGSLRVNLAQYRELEAFSLFASDLDKTSRAQLDRGARMVELLKQGAFQPMPVPHQVVALWAGNEGFLDVIPVPDVKRFEAGLIEHIDLNHKDLFETIRTTGKLPDEGALRSAVETFAKSFQPSGDAPAAVNEAERQGDIETDQEILNIKRPKPKTGPVGAGSTPSV